MVKPSVSAGSKDTGRFGPRDREAAEALAATIAAYNKAVDAKDDAEFKRKDLPRALRTPKAKWPWPMAASSSRSVSCTRTFTGMPAESISSRAAFSGAALCTPLAIPNPHRVLQRAWRIRRWMTVRMW